MSATICPSCLSRSFDAGRCGKCGFVSGEYTAARTALPLGSLVGNYRIGVMKTNSRQSQIYTAVHNETSVPAIIEEFFPAKVAGRAQNAEEVTLASQDPEVLSRFQQGCLLIEASAQKRPLKRIDTVRQNNTVYSVFEPAATMNAATQCEMMADNPYYFRDQNGMPQMTINTLPIPPMPKERRYNAEQYLNRRPITKPSDESDRFGADIITESVEKDRKRRKWLVIGIAAAAVILLAVGGLIAARIINKKGGEDQNSVSPPPEVSDTVSPADELTATESPSPENSPEPEPTETGYQLLNNDNNNDKVEDGTIKSGVDVDIKGGGKEKPAADKDEESQDTAPDEAGVKGEQDKTPAEQQSVADADQEKKTGQESSENYRVTDDGEPEEGKREGAETAETKPEGASAEADSVAVTEVPEAQDHTSEILTVPDFLSHLKVVSRSGVKTLQGRRLDERKKDWDKNTEEVPLPTDIRLHEYTKAGKKTPVTSLFWTKLDSNQLYALARKGADWYRVQVGKRENLSTDRNKYDDYQYTDDEDLAVCLELWQDLGDSVKGAYMAFVPVAENGSVLEMLNNELTEALLWEKQEFVLKEDNGQKMLVISAGSKNMQFYLKPLEMTGLTAEETTPPASTDAPENTPENRDTSTDIPAPSATPVPTDTPAQTETASPSATAAEEATPTKAPEGNQVGAGGLIVRSGDAGSQASAGTAAPQDSDASDVNLKDVREIEQTFQNETNLTIKIRASKDVINIVITDSLGEKIPMETKGPSVLNRDWIAWTFSRKQNSRAESITIVYTMRDGRTAQESRSLPKK